MPHRPAGTVILPRMGKSGKPKRKGPSQGKDALPRMSVADLKARATVDLLTAAGTLGIGRTKAYELARASEFPCRVLRIGNAYIVPTTGLLELLGEH